jgi:hypothetical protein
MPKGIYRRRRRARKLDTTTPATVQPVTPRRRRTVAAPVATATAPLTPAQSAGFTFNSIGEFLAAAREAIGLVNHGATPMPGTTNPPAVVAAPVAAQPVVTAPPVIQARIGYAFNPTPHPPMGESVDTLFAWLRANPGVHTQQEMEAGSKLSEGQVKGAIRQLHLAGYVTREKLNGGS